MAGILSIRTSKFKAGKKKMEWYVEVESNNDVELSESDLVTKGSSIGFISAITNKWIEVERT
jgi:hypothetical protein